MKRETNCQSLQCVFSALLTLGLDATSRRVSAETEATFVLLIPAVVLFFGLGLCV